MRIVILYNTSWYVYLLRQNLIRALMKEGCEVIVVSPRDTYTGRILSLGVRHVSLPLLPKNTNPLLEVRTIRSLISIMRIVKPDAVLSFTVKCNLYAGICKRFVKFLHIANISGLGSAFEQRGTMRSIVKALYRLSLRKSEYIFFQNAEDRAICTSQGLVADRVSSVIPGSGVDLAAFTPQTRAPSNPRVFLMFGRLIPQKGYDRYLQAAAHMRKEFGEAVEFWILGTPDTSQKDSTALFRRILTSDGQGDIRYLNSTDDVRPILKSCDVVVLPSTYNEGIPRSLLESMACGKPIITTDWKGCRETVRHGANGFLINPRDGESLLRAIRHMITCPPEMLEAMGRESRRLAEEQFDEEVVLRAYLDALSLAPKQPTIGTSMKRTGTDP